MGSQISPTSKPLNPTLRVAKPLFSANNRRIARVCFNRSWTLFSLGCLLFLVGCASTSPNSQSGDPPSPLAGNWKFAMAAPSDGSFLGGLQGGFLSRNGKNVNGSSVYAMWVESSQFCSSGSAPITGMIEGQNVKL